MARKKKSHFGGSTKILRFEISYLQFTGKLSGRKKNEENPCGKTSAFVESS